MIRRRVEKVSFVFKKSDKHIDEGKEITWDSLPEGKYFFHCTTIQHLASIKRLGLVPPTFHKFGRYWENLLRDARKDRLFFCTNEDDCFFWLQCMEYLSPHTVGKLVVLRFERFVIAGSELFSDPLYLPEIEISFSANCKIPPQYLEACVHPTHDKCPEWAPIVL